MTGYIPRFCPHCNGPLDVTRTIQWGGWTFDEEKRALSPTGRYPLILTPHEGALVSTLLRAEGRVVRRSGGMYSAICNGRPEADWPNVQLVDVTLSKLRRKLKIVYERRVLISSVRESGYYAVPFNVEVLA